ncbi:sigma-70 family RNA polymerase sigma factor [Streptomyces palmae]|uniref:Sigma-70 family RNA polymerase sigma factor n=2 Tax=Streptomyces palmae TaxID=1701085 RepID=A0A4Z0HA12_9ACTN|nr:sigma-70 family RNA polymerase sigma factor [Streptomyces palmae]TGB14610.1 sigma-70 family RNA polymerase sigma factor [Streptomyces palmae]
MTGLPGPPDDLPTDFRAFHELHREAYVRRAHTIVNDRSDAELAVDAAFEQLARSWKKVLAMKNPAGYAWTVMKNRAIDMARSRGRRIQLEHAVFETAALRTAVDPIDQLAESLLLRQAVAALTDRQQDVIVLLYYHAYTAAEAATHLGITAAGVRSIARSARRALHQILEHSGDIDDLTH